MYDDKNECKGCGNCNFCKGLVTRGSGLWMHWDYFSNQITFSEIEMWTPKEAFSQQKLIAGSIFFKPRKNKVDFFSSEVLLILSRGMGCLCFPGAVLALSSIDVCSEHTMAVGSWGQTEKHCSHILNYVPLPFPILPIQWYTGLWLGSLSWGEKIVYTFT